MKKRVKGEKVLISEDFAGYENRENRVGVVTSYVSSLDSYVVAVEDSEEGIVVGSKYLLDYGKEASTEVSAEGDFKEEVQEEQDIDMDSLILDDSEDEDDTELSVEDDDLVLPDDLLLEEDEENISMSDLLVVEDNEEEDLEDSTLGISEEGFNDSSNEEVSEGGTLKGVIDFKGMEVECEIEFMKSVWGREICIHFPDNIDTSNWYHAVTVKRDLKSYRLPTKEEQ